MSTLNKNEGKKMSTELKENWTIERLRIREDNMNKDLFDYQVLKQFEHYIKFKNHRYEVHLPIKSCEEQVEPERKSQLDLKIVTIKIQIASV